MKVINPIGRNVSLESEVNAIEPRACICSSGSASTKGILGNLCSVCNYNCNGTSANNQANHTKSMYIHKG
ncbi:MAG: hypothetical protein LBR30_06015 [Clostridioides sp.]|jgi:hypothetical protein|nr:hypothetical protein [Clostridioides sp.]